MKESDAMVTSTSESKRVIRGEMKEQRNTKVLVTRVKGRNEKDSQEQMFETLERLKEAYVSEKIERVNVVWVGDVNGWIVRKMLECAWYGADMTTYTCKLRINREQKTKKNGVSTVLIQKNQQKNLSRNARRAQKH